MLSNLQGSLGPALRRLLPLLMLCLLGMANVMFCVTSVVPQTRAYDSAQQQLSTAEAQYREAQAMAEDPQTAMIILQRQLDNARAQLNESANVFLTEVQANELIERLYWYADQVGVQVTSLQTQTMTSQATPAPDGSQSFAYTARAVQMQVNGSVQGLLQYLVRFRELAAQAVVVNSLDISQAEVGSTLLLAFDLYTSPSATGLSLTALPPAAEIASTPYSPMVALQIPTNTPVFEPTATAVVPTATATATLTATPSLVPTATDVPTSTPTPVPTATLTSASIASAPDTALELLFEETFDVDPLYAWTIGAGWSLVNVANGRALQAQGAAAPTILRYSDVGNGAMELRFLLEDGSARFRLRGSQAGNYTLDITAPNLLLLYRANVPVQNVALPESLLGEWHTLRFSAIDNIVRVAIDGEEQIIAFDSLPLPPGDVAFSSIGGTFYVDNVRVLTPEGAEN